MKRMIMSVFTIFAVVASVSGATHAVFSDTETIPGNTVSAGTVDISIVNTSPLVLSNLAPGEWTHYGSASSDWHRANIQNVGSLPVDVYKHIEITNNEYCDEFTIQFRSRVGNSWNPTHYEYTIEDLEAAGPIKVSHNSLTTDPGWGPGQLRTFSRVQLNPNASNDAQGATCTWDTVYTAESILP